MTPEEEKDFYQKRGYTDRAEFEKHIDIRARCIEASARSARGGEAASMIIDRARQYESYVLSLGAVQIQEDKKDV